MQLINVDAIQSQSLEAALYRLAQMFRARIMGPLIRSWPIPASLGRDHQVFGVRRQCFGDQLFADARAIGVRGINEVDAQLYGTPQDGQRAGTVPGWSPDPFACNTHSSEAKTMHGKLTAEGHFSS